MFRCAAAGSRKIWSGVAPCWKMPACALQGRGFVSNGAGGCGLLLRSMGPGLVKAVGGSWQKEGASEGCGHVATCERNWVVQLQGSGQGQGAPRARPRELQKPSGNVGETSEIFGKPHKTVRNLGELFGFLWNCGNCGVNFGKTLA